VTDNETDKNGVLAGDGDNIDPDGFYFKTEGETKGGTQSGGEFLSAAKQFAPDLVRTDAVLADD
jgi:hypothetical protein